MENAMTPQERQLIDDLFDRLAKLENAPRDSEAMSAIMQGLRNAPNAVYALVQTALVQDEALKRANDRIQQLEGGHAPEQNQPGGFLDSMRDSIFGPNQPQGSVPQGSVPQGSVPNVRAPGVGGRPVWNSGEVMQQTQGQGPGQYNQGGYGQQPSYGQPAYGQPYGAQQPPPLGGGGGSFLGTAAAAAAGVVGGSMLLGGIRSMMGGGSHQQAFGDTGGYRGSVEDRRPGGSDQSGGDLARDAGINDIGSSGNSRTGLLDNNSTGDSSRAGFFDSASNDDNHDDMDHDSDGFDSDGDSDNV
jgi:hypothetical protein